MNSRIFQDPTFIRRNVLINFLYSSFSTADFQQKPFVTFSDRLRVAYHNLTLENDPDERKAILSLIYSVLFYKMEHMTDMDWHYSERIMIHYANFYGTPPNDLLSRIKWQSKQF